MTSADRSRSGRDSSRNPRRSATRTLAGAAAVTLAAMIATPLVRRGGPARRALSSVVVTGLFTTTTAAASRRWGTVRTTGAAAGVAVGTAAVEHLGTATGVPFGRVVLGAAALTAWDLFLDPQMVGEGYWRWARVGRYRRIPASNFAGWFVVSLAVMGALELALPADEAPDPALVAEYGAMAVMETLGFAAFFRDRVVAAVGGAAMLPVAAAAARTLWRGRRWTVVGG